MEAAALPGLFADTEAAAGALFLSTKKSVKFV